MSKRRLGRRIALRTRHLVRRARAIQSRRLVNFLLCIGGFTALALLMILAVPGCPPPSGPQPMPGRTAEGVPVVRVLVASGPSVRLAANGPYRVLADGRPVAAPNANSGLAETEVACSGGAWRLGGDSFSATTLTVQPVGRTVLYCDGSAYRGWLVLKGQGGGVQAVNHVDAESYLAGVLGRELYPGWHPNAYKAQAIAARTFALYERAVNGQGKDYDVRDDQSSQVYGGCSGESSVSWRAVRATHGQVLAAGSAGRESIFRAHFSSCCGGMANSVYAMYGPPVGPDSPLRGGQVCNDCTGATHYRWPAVAVPKNVIHRALGKTYPAVYAMRDVARVDLAEPVNGRYVWADIRSSDGQAARVRAEDVRLCLLRDGEACSRALYSMNCTLRDQGDSIVFENGRGYGHGVGLCQWGCQGMALRGLKPEQIVLHYYPGAKLIKAY